MNRKAVMHDKCFTMMFDKVLTPCYIIDKVQFLKNLNSIRNNFRKEWGENLELGYSVKTNHLSTLLGFAKNENMFAEVVSEDEYYYVMEQGYSHNRIILNGPQKSKKCLKDALRNGSIVNIDNINDISIIAEAQKQTVMTDIRVGLRINFDLKKMCKEELKDKENESRFGLCVENGEFENAINKLNKLHIRISGLHIHYTTKTRSLKVFKTLAEKVCEIGDKYGLIDEINYIDMGGGFWGGRIMKEKPTMSEYSVAISNILKRKFDPKKVQLILEPGSALLATVATYYSRVINIKKVREISIITIDGSLLHVNPFFLPHRMECKAVASGKSKICRQLICGSTCLENDRIAQLDEQTEIMVGDYVQIDYVGAYTMGFNNCFINLPPYIYLKNGEDISLIRGRDKRLVSYI